MNTGVQRSSATPPAARTATTPARRRASPATCSAPARACRRSPWRTAFPTSPRRPSPTCTTSRRKVDKAMGMRGARYIHVLVPCPLGWGSASHDTIRLARLARRVRPVPGVRGRARRRDREPQDPPTGAGRGVPEAAEALRPPVRVGRGRATHRQAAGDRRSQHRRATACSMPDGDALMEQALRHHARCRLEPRQPHRLVAHRAAGLRRPPAAVQPRLPGRREHPGLALPRRSRATTRGAWRALTQDNPMPAVMGRVCYHPCETACNRGELDDAVGINSVERFLGDEAIKQRLAASPPPAQETGKRVLVVGAGPSGLSAAYHLRAPRPRRRRSTKPGPIAGGMMRFGIPKYRLPRDVLDAEIARILDLGVTLAAQHQGRRHLEAMSERRLRRGVPRGRRAHRQARLHPGRATRARSSTPSRCCARWRARTSRCSAAAWSSTAAATPRSTSRAPPSASARRRRSSSIAARAIGCRRTTSRSRRRSRKA